MRDILFLAHRIPYPPDKGDKIRSWNVSCNTLPRGHRVHLCAFATTRTTSAGSRDWRGSARACSGDRCHRALPGCVA